MTKWVAKFQEGDMSFGEEILLGITGGEYGFEVILSNEDDSDLLPEASIEEAMEALEEAYGSYDTFAWLPDED